MNEATDKDTITSKDLPGLRAEMCAHNAIRTAR